MNSLLRRVCVLSFGAACVLAVVAAVFERPDARGAILEPEAHAAPIEVVPARRIEALASEVRRIRAELSVKQSRIAPRPPTPPLAAPPDRGP